MHHIKINGTKKLKIFSFLLLGVGESLIIISFLYFGRSLQSILLILNIIVTTIIYLLLFIDILIPMVAFKDASHKTVGSIGLRWFFTIFYMVVAIVVMAIFNIDNSINIYSQIIIYGILLFLLLLGLYFAKSSSHKVEKVFFEENQAQSRVEDIKKAIKGIQLKLDQMNNIPTDTIKRINALQEDLRFMIPSNNQNAFELDTTYISEVKSIQDHLSNIPINYDKINESIQNCESLYKEKKKIFSN